MTAVGAAPNAPQIPGERLPTDWHGAEMQARIRRRYRAERRFRYVGLTALATAVLFLVFLLFSVVWSGSTGFLRTEVAVDVRFDASTLGIRPGTTPNDDRQAWMQADYAGALIDSAERGLGPGSADLLSDGAWLTLRDALVDDPALLGRTKRYWVPTTSDIDMLAKGRIDRADDPSLRRVDDETLALYDRLKREGRVRTTFNTAFLTGADSTTPEMAGVWGAAKGSMLTLLITLAVSFPIGLLSAIYLEEFAPKNRLTDLIEVSINNLAAVPSIIFGLLGLAVLLNTFGMPRSAPVVGGLTLALMTLPVIVIASRISIKSVPPSIRDAALGIGASRIQAVFHHVLPMALPGIMTGTIIGMARALGETAPLLMIGMRAFMATSPDGVTDPATVLPVQIFLWSDDVQRGFVEKTSAAIMVLLLFLLLMNGVAIFLRNKFERRW